VFEAWGRVIFRRRPTLAVAAIGVVLAAIWGTGVFGRLHPAGAFVPPAASVASG
jgi:trehalose monomycolate/heme transporter